jgi:calcineurin-like phosphoesterase family protein
MDWEMVKRWNEVVKPNDEVWHLGDVALGSIHDSLALLNACNGRKYLVPGNHDRIFSGNRAKDIVRFLPIYSKVFDDVYPEITTDAINGQIVNVSHFPYTGDSHDTDRYKENRPFDNGLPLICGHVHGAWRANGNMFNVGVDVNDFRPVSEDTIADWLDKLVVNKYY